MKRRAPSQAPAEEGQSKEPPFKMNKQQWKETLSQLDLQRDCSAPMSDDCCWLCDELEEWNAALNPLQLSLDERVPGKIWLCSLAAKPQFSLKRGTIPYDATYFIAWLPRKHHCIEGIHFSRNMPRLCECAAPDSVAGMPSGVRLLCFSGNASFDWGLVLDALHPIVQLRGIAFDGVQVSGTLAAKAAQLLSANACTVEDVRLYETEITGSDSNMLMSAIAKCKNLTALVFDAGLNLDGMRDFSKLLQSTTTLDKLLLVTRDINHGYDRTMSDYKQLVAAASALLKRNTTLTQLCYRGCKEELASILEALETNDVLKKFSISGHEVDRLGNMKADSTLGKQVKAMLSRNRGLLTLTLSECEIDDQCGALVAQGLVENTTLKCLDVSECKMTFDAMHALCTALEKNKTCSLEIGSFEHWPPLRDIFSETVARNNCYGRVHLLNWGCSDAEQIAASLLEPSLCPTELHLQTGYFSEKSFSLLCQALSSSLQIRSLTVVFQAVSPVYLDSLRKALEKNVSLKSITLEECGNIEGAAVFAVEGLHANTSVTELTMECYELGAPFMRSLGQMIANNENLNSVKLVCDQPLATPGMKYLSEGIVQNRFITDFCIIADTPARSRTAILAALQRNMVWLHRAIRFALGRNQGKLCAEAFELLSCRAYFVEKVMKASDMTEAEAKAAVEAAKLFIRHNYLLINEIFRHKLECHAGNGTQIDQLNFDCWRAITKYLKVSDIIYE